MNESSKPDEISTPTVLQKEDPLHTLERTIEGIADLNQKDWSIAISGKVDEERETVAVTLMKSFSEGAADVVRSVIRRGRLPANYRVPHTRIGDNAGIDASYHFAVAEVDGLPTRVVRSEIVVDAKGLDALAQDNPLDIYQISRKNPDGTHVVTSVGTSEELAYTTGAEEAAHSIFLYQDVERGKFRPNENRGNESINVAAYDAQPMEYHGRGWQVRAILDARNAGKITAEEAERLVQPFIDRIKAAAKYRSEKKSAAIAT
jgi:hypothetical protein